MRQNLREDRPNPIWSAASSLYLSPRSLSFHMDVKPASTQRKTRATPINHVIGLLPHLCLLSFGFLRIQHQIRHSGVESIDFL